jgi:hypothetical protein
MHRKHPISVLVYNNLFPTPSPTDPPSFSAHLSKNLVGEVRIETANFYGSLDTIEARYPGLNYAFAPHRKRLGRFPHHRRLFDAFDALGLTEAEIQGFCRWEGTLWARERYERDEGVRVVDTTGEEIGVWVDKRRKGLGMMAGGRSSITRKTDIEVEITQNQNQIPQHPEDIDTQMSEPESSSEDDTDHPSTETHTHALAFALNHHPMSPEWEQYLKEAQERGELNIDAARQQVADQQEQPHAAAA